MFTFPGILIHLASCGCNITSLTCLQVIRHVPPDFELNTLRFGIGLVLAMTILGIKRQLPTLERKDIGWFTLGLISVFMYNVTLYTSYVKALPLGALFGIRQGFMVIFIAVSTKIIMKTYYSVWKLFLITSTMVGLGFVVFSSFVYGCHKKETPSSWPNVSVSDPPGGSMMSLTMESHEQNNTMIPQLEFKNATTVFDFALNNTTKIPHFEMNITQMEHCHKHRLSLETIGLAISFLAGNAFCCTVESLTLAASSLKEVDSLVITFWYCIFGTMTSMVTASLLEDTFIPVDILDRILCVIHCTTAALITFLSIFALKFVHPTIVSVLSTGQIPVTLFLQMVLLQTVTPPVEIWALILGNSVITLSVFTYSLTAVLERKAKNGDNNMS